MSFIRKMILGVVAICLPVSVITMLAAQAQKDKNKPRSSYAGKAVYEKGFVKLPDGRKVKAPAGYNWGKGRTKMDPSADEAMREVAEAAKEMVREEVKEDTRGIVSRPGALKGKQSTQPAQKKMPAKKNQ